MRRLTNNSDLLLLVADLHKYQVAIICFEPEPDGSGGTAYHLRDALSQANRRGEGGPPSQS
jgi:hypothetical protein